MKHYLTWVILIATLGLLSAQNESFTLQEAINYALTNNTDIKIGQNNIKDAEQQIIERRASGLPQLNGTVSYNHFAVLPVTVLPEQFALDPSTGKPNPNFDRNVKFGVKNNLTGTLSLSTLLFDGSYLVGLQAARDYKTYVNKELASKQYDIKNQVIMAYLPALLIDLGVETLDKNIANLQKLSNETKEIFKQGFAEQLDIDRLELSLSNLKSEKDNLLRQKLSALNYLKFVMNYPVSKNLEIGDNIASFESQASDAALSGKIAYESRPEYDVIKKGLDLNELNVKLNKAGYLPSLSAFANYQYIIQGDKLFSGAYSSPAFILGGKLNVPIFDSFMKKAKISRAKIQTLNFLEQKNVFERSVDLEVSNARNNFNNANERLANQKKNIALAEKIYETTQTKYKNGLGSSLEITQAEQSLYATQQQYNQALYDVIVANFNLNKAIGK